jgi:hypothetical protein
MRLFDIVRLDRRWYLFEHARDFGISTARMTGALKLLSPGQQNPALADDGKNDSSTTVDLRAVENARRRYDTAFRCPCAAATHGSHRR